jgi:hypothetical protein
MSNLDNPYATPFFACDPSTMDELTLVVERGHWQNVVPTTGECVAIKGSGEGAVTQVEDDIAANGDDLYAILGASGHTASSLITTSNFLTVGKSLGGQRYGFSVRFSSVAIPDGATILGAYISLECSSDKSSPTGANRVIRIYGDDADNSAQIASLADWNGRSLTSAYTDWTAPEYPVSAGAWYNTADITDVVEEIRARGGWSSGNALHFFIEEQNCDNSVYYDFAANEHTTYDQAKLFIDYAYGSGVTTATCDDVTFATSKYRQAPITHIYIDDGGVFSINHVNSTAYDLLPATPAVNDAIYFGIASANPDSGPFNNLVFDIGTVQSGCTIVWEYFQGGATSAWSTLGSTALIDTTQSFTNEGIGSLTFLQPWDSSGVGSWTATTVNTVAGYWIRARVTGVSSPTPPAQQNRSIYSTAWPFVEFEADGVDGDIPALARIEFSGHGQCNASYYKQTRFIAALQSNRGPYGDQGSYDFSAYFPLCDEQLPSLMSALVISGEFSHQWDITTATARAVRLNPTSTGEKSFYFVVNSLHFHGTYRAFLRVRQQGGSDNDFLCRFEVTDRTTYQTLLATKDVAVTIQSGTTNYAVEPFWQLLDLGAVTIPVGVTASNEGGSLNFDIVTTVNSTTGDLYYHDLILMPADEWIVDTQDLVEDGWYWSEKLHIDSLTVPRIDVRSLTKWDSESGANPRTWKTVGTQMRLPTNVGGKIWILSAQRASTGEWLSDGYMVTKVGLFAAQQYLGLRGSR